MSRTGSNVMSSTYALGMATMQQAGMVTREFAREFEWHARDAGMAKEDAKVHLVLALN